MLSAAPSPTGKVTLFWSPALSTQLLRTPMRHPTTAPSFVPGIPARNLWSSKQHSAVHCSNNGVGSNVSGCQAKDSATAGGVGNLRKNWKNLSKEYGHNNPKKGPQDSTKSESLPGEDEWRDVDKKVNKYPGYRSFTVIGEGGAEYRTNMVQAVSIVVGSSIGEECVKEKKSSGNKYLSVTIGPIIVQSADQVVEIFSAVRSDSRTKYCM